MKSYESKIGKVSLVLMEEIDVFSKDVINQLTVIKEEWVRFENSFTSLKGRKLMGLAYGEPGNGIYRLCSTILPSDPIGEVTHEVKKVPGGYYLRHRITGTLPQLYDNIGTAFQLVFDNHIEIIDWERPTIEYYKSKVVIDCLVPVKL